MIDSSTICMRIDNIFEFLSRLKIPGVSADTLWRRHNAQMHLKLLKTFCCYTAKWSDKDKSRRFASPSTWTWIKDRLNSLEKCLSSYNLDQPDSDGRNTTEMRVVNECYRNLKHCFIYVENDYVNLLNYSYSHSPMTDALVFGEFVISVQEFLVSIPLEWGSGFNVLRSKPCEWLPSSSRAMEGYYNATASKLGSFKNFICNFAKRCIDEEKLKFFLARAGVVVLSIAHLACRNNNEHIRSWWVHDLQWKFLQRVLSASSDLSKKISPHNPDVVEIYRGVLEAYVEVIKAAKSPGSVTSMTVEDLVSSSFNFLFFAHNQVDIIGDVLDSQLLDLVLNPDDYTEDVELFLTHGVAAVVRETGSLIYSICIDKIPNGKGMRETFPVISKLLHKIKLIKAEIFLLELHKQKTKLMVPVEDRVAAIREAMGFLVKFFKTPEGYMDDSEKMILTFIEAVVREAGTLCNSFNAGKVSEDMILDSSLAMFKLFKAEARLIVLIKNKASLKFLAKYRIETFHKGLMLLRALLSDPTDNLEDQNYSTFIEALASEATFLVCTFGDNNMEKDQPMEMNLLLSGLPRAIELHFSEIQAIYQQGPWSLFSNFPKSDAVDFIEFLLAEMRELLINKPDAIACLKDQVEMLLVELELLRSFLKDVAEEHNENKDLQTRVLCQMYEAEHIIDLFVAGDVPLWYHQLVLLNAIEETNLITAHVLKFYDDKMRRQFAVQSVKQTSREVTPEASNPTIDEVIVLLDDQAEIIIDQLKSGIQQLQIVSIVGMAGLGKTTLAKKIYSSSSIEYHFIVRAWCYVSQVYRKRELLLDILADLVELTDQIRGKDDEHLALTLYQGLKGKRYLIVLDDIWSIEPWNDLKRLLPDDKNGSRVLLTSRLRDVALQINPSMEPHSLPLLSYEKSWELLQEKVFREGSCPEELLQAGGEIAKNCKGLPLAVVVVAGLLKRTDMNISWWKEVARSLRSLISHDQERQFTDILEFSYSHLPIYLKPCFLYLGAFLEDQEIPVNKLKWLWIAEGFVPKSDSKCSEETADDYLMDLIGRSLVMDAKRRSKGGTKTCRMHDMLRDLCLKKASEENFMQLISTQPGGISQNYYPSDFAASMKYRLCVHSSKQHFLQSIPFGPHVHSLLFFAISSTEAGRSHDVSFISHKFKLLRVLDLESLHVGQSFPNGIELMFRLSYLAIRGNINSVPSSIADLWNLETLIVKGMRGEVELPETIWSMARLRHVQVNNRANFTLPSHGIENSVLFDNLATFSSPVLRYGEETGKMLRRLIKLRKLRCIFMEPLDYDRKCNLFPALDSLTRLESLKIFYHCNISFPISFPCEFSFPPNLKKLTLSKFRMPWEYISEIRGLPNLEVLKLASKAFEGRTWDMTELEEFPNLKFLKLEGLDIAIWNASSDHFPKLRQLVLQSCKKLEKVPSSFGEISTLEVIEMHWCTSAAASSIGTIHEQQIDLGNEEFKVSISPAEWDFRKST